MRTCTRRELVGITAALPAVLAGCSGLGRFAGGDPAADAIDVLIDNQHMRAQDVSIEIRNGETGDVYFDRSVTLRPNEQDTGSFPDPGSVVLAVDARLGDDRHESVRIEPDERTADGMVRADVLPNGDLSVSWATSAER